MDPLGLISNVSPIARPGIAGGLRQDGSQLGRTGASAPDFREMLKQQIQQVNELQSDASAAIEDLAAGRRDDLEGVILATQKADVAFKMLLQVRNKVMEALEEVKQIRV